MICSARYLFIESESGLTAFKFGQIQRGTLPGDRVVGPSECIL